MGNLRTALDVIEFNGARHRVRDLEGGPVAGIYSNLAQTPEANRDIPRPGALYAKYSFNTDVAGSGTAGTAPVFGPLLTAAAMSESVLGATSVTYALSPTYATTAVDIDVFRGNALLCSCDSSVSKVEFIMEPNKPMIANWEVIGLYTEPTALSGVAALGTTARSPICKGLVVVVAGIPVKLKQLRLAINNLWAEPDEDICGTNGVIAPSIYDRNIEIDATFRTQLPATKNWWNLLSAESKVSFAVNYGATPGNILGIVVDGYYRDTIEPSKAEGRHEMTIKTEMSREAGDTALSMVFT